MHFHLSLISLIFLFIFLNFEISLNFRLGNAIFSLLWNEILILKKQKKISWIMIIFLLKINDSCIILSFQNFKKIGTLHHCPIIHLMSILMIM